MKQPHNPDDNKPDRNESGSGAVSSSIPDDLRELTFGEQQEITKFLEDYRYNHSNTNKARYGLFAYIDTLFATQTAQLKEQVLAAIGPSESLTEEQITNGRIYKLGDPQGDAVDRYKDELRAAIEDIFKEAK